MSESRDLLPLYLTGDLPPHEEDRIEEELARSPALRRELAALGETLGALQRAGTDGDAFSAAVPDAFPDDFYEERIVPRLRPPGGLRRLAWAAALALAFGAGFLVAPDPAPPPGNGTERSQKASPSVPPGPVPARTSLGQALEILRRTR